jgi:hypothetical protein
MSLLWMTIEPRETETRLQLSEAARGLCLRARLPVCPHHGRGLAMMLEAIVAWYGRPLTAVLDAAAQDVARHPERWARLLGDLDGEAIRVEWVAPLRRKRCMNRTWPGAVGAGTMHGCAGSTPESSELI